MKRFAVLNIFAFLLFALSAQQTAFKPGQTSWPDNKNTHINAHGGGVLYYGGSYYWFGEYKNNRNNNAEHGVSCYSSTDLYNWYNQGIALAVQSGTDVQSGCIIERPKVIYNNTTGKFVMYFHLELKNQGYDAARVGIAVADQVTGPYVFKESIRPNKQQRAIGYIPGQDFDNEYSAGETNGQMSRDMTLFVDDDGKAYHIYSSENNATLHISLLSNDYLSHSGQFVRLAPGGYNEAPAVFKRAGKYFMITSGCTGWDPNAARLFMADAMLGTWTEYPNPCVGTNSGLTFNSQSTYVIPVAGKTNAYIFMADRWKPNNPITGQYVWLPVDFENGLPVLKWFDSWNLTAFDTKNTYANLSSDITKAEALLASVIIGSKPKEFKQPAYDTFLQAVLQAKLIASTAGTTEIANTIYALSTAASTFQNARNPRERNMLPDGDYRIKVKNQYYLTNDFSLVNGQKLKLQAQKTTRQEDQIFMITKQTNGRYKILSKLDGRNVNENICIINSWDNEAMNWRTVNIYYDGTDYAIQNDGKAAQYGAWAYDSGNNNLKALWEYWLRVGGEDFIFSLEEVTTAPPAPLQFPAFTDVTSSLSIPNRTDFFRGNALWGDFDNDGYSEAIVFATDWGWGYRAHYMENTNGTLVCGNFTDLGLPAFNNDRWDWTSAWIDYNNDGWLDLLFTGRQGGSGIAELYKNNGAGVNGTTVKRFELVSGTGITGLLYSGEEGISVMSRIAVGDYDHDGYPDFIMTGIDNGVSTTCLYKNNGGNGTFTLQATPVNGTSNFTPTREGNVIMADFNNDGWLDVLINGWPVGAGASITNLYKNLGNGTFSEDIDFSASPYRYTTATGDTGIGDLNGDGKLDILLTGKAYDPGRIQGYDDWVNNTAAFYLSKTSGYDLFSQGLGGDSDPNHVTRVRTTAIDLIDLNADGNLDMVVSGDYWDDAARTFIYLNDGIHPNGSMKYANSQAGLANSRSGALTFEDYDRDGYMDVMMLGYESGFRIYHNNGNLTKNTRPSAPTNLSSSYASGKWTLTWDAGSDAETPVQSLRYNVFIKLPGTDKVFMNIPADLATGYLKQSRHHAALNTTSYTIALPHEKLEWGVQTIDQGKLSSAFAVEEKTPYIVNNTSKTWAEYLADYGGDIVFEDDGQLSGITGTKTVKGAVKIVKTFDAKKWYAIGFPFDIASVRCDLPDYDHYDLKTYNPGGASGDKGDYWLRTYNGLADTFNDYTYGATSILSGGYVLQLPTNLDGATFTFTSHPNVTLSNSNELDFLAGAYKLTVNPSVVNTMIANDATNHFYAFEYTPQTGNFGLLTTGYSLKPFEPVVIANAITGPLRSSLNVEQLTSLPAFDLSEIIATEYYNLQGMRVMQPQQGQFYIIKSVYKSGAIIVVKKIKQ